MNTLAPWSNTELLPPCGIFFCKAEESVYEAVQTQPGFKAERLTLVVALAEEIFGFYHYSARELESCGIRGGMAIRRLMVELLQCDEAWPTVQNPSVFVRRKEPS